MELGEDGQYLALGDALDVERQAASNLLFEVLPSSFEDAWTEEEFIQRLKGSVSRTTFRRVLSAHMAVENINRKKGKGKSGTAFGYWLTEQGLNSPVPMLNQEVTRGTGPGHSVSDPNGSGDTDDEVTNIGMDPGQLVEERPAGMGVATAEEQPDEELTRPPSLIGQMVKQREEQL